MHNRFLIPECSWECYLVLQELYLVLVHRDSYVTEYYTLVLSQYNREGLNKQ